MEVDAEKGVLADILSHLGIPEIPAQISAEFLLVAADQFLKRRFVHA